MKQVIQGSLVPIKIWSDVVEDKALEQLKNLSALPFIFKHVSAMPDVHAGYGSTVGSVIATKGAIIPAAVGVDIGCGMMACPTTLKAHDLPDNLAKLREEIEKVVPHGFETVPKYSVQGNWTTDNVSDRTVKQWVGSGLAERFERLVSVEPLLERKAPLLQLGTLGGGNHFVEICLDERDTVWVMLHSGSRGIGNLIGTHYTTMAKKDMERYFINLPDKDLAYFPEGSTLFDEYIEAMMWAQDYASINRQMMMGAVLGCLREHILKPFVVAREDLIINCHHNYATKEHHFNENVWVTRKGAVRAREGEFGIIPGSMGAKSYIVVGKGEAQSFTSCSHGAGRKMSRGKAKEAFTIDDVMKQTLGVECKKDSSVIDEIPGAYKDIDQVMEFQTDLVDKVFTLKQVLCVKG